VIGGIVPDNVDHSLVGIASLNLGQKLRGTNAVDGGWLDKWRGLANQTANRKVGSKQR
jgi:hypothetical protein